MTTVARTTTECVIICARPYFVFARGQVRPCLLHRSLFRIAALASLCGSRCFVLCNAACPPSRSLQPQAEYSRPARQAISALRHCVRRPDLGWSLLSRLFRKTIVKTQLFQHRRYAQNIFGRGE